MAEQLQEGAEERHDLISHAIAEARNRLDKRLPLWQRGLHERYLAGEIQLEMRIVGRREGRDWSAVFYRSAMPNLLEMDLAHIGVSAWPGSDADVSQRICREVESAVLIDPVEFMDDPQGIFGVGGATVIRLYALDGFDGVRVNPLELMQTAPWRGFPGLLLDTMEQVNPKVVAALRSKDGEFRRLLCRRRDGVWSVMHNRQFKGEMVKRGAERMNGITRDQGKLGRRWFGDLRADDCLTRLGISVPDEGVCARPEPGVSHDAKVFYVLARPVELL